MNSSRRWQAFRANKRASFALYLFVFLFVMSLLANFIANDKPLVIHYDHQWFFPSFHNYTEQDFGGDLPLMADYRDASFQQRIEKQGWMLWPLVRFNYSTINYDREGVYPLPPGDGNILGTDDQGRDVFARLLYGFRLSVLFGLALAVATSVIGIFIGAIQGYFAGRIDLLGQRFMEVWAGIPTLYLIIIISASIQLNFWILLLIMIAFGWMRTVHVVRAECLKVRNLDYVNAARTLGISEFKILIRHVLPNALVAVLAIMPFLINGSIVALTGLDYLGFGLPAGYPSLGEMIAQGKNNLHAPWIGLSIFTVLASLLIMLVLIGEGVRDAFDPKVFLQKKQRVVDQSTSNKVTNL